MVTKIQNINVKGNHVGNSFIWIGWKITFSFECERRFIRWGKAPASRTALTPASTPHAKLPMVAAHWMRRQSTEEEADERIETTEGTAPSLMYESFFVRLPIIWFLSSLRTFNLASPPSAAAERSRSIKPSGRWVVDAEPGMVVGRRRMSYAPHQRVSISALVWFRKKWDFNHHLSQRHRALDLFLLSDECDQPKYCFAKFYSKIESTIIQLFYFLY